MLLSAFLLVAAYAADPPLIVNPPPPRGAEALSAYGLGIEALPDKAVRPLFAKPPRARRGETMRGQALKTGAPAFRSAPTWCGESGLQRARIFDASVSAKLTPLGDLPQANHTLTVLRKVDGCPVSSTVRFNVGR
jgi:hypothetical protein